MKKIISYLKNALSAKLTGLEKATINNINNESCLVFKAEKIHRGKRVIYFLIKDNEVVYIGKSENSGVFRPFQHLSSDKEFDSIKVFSVPDDADIDRIESSLLLSYLPRNQSFCKNLLIDGIPTLSVKLKNYVNVQYVLNMKRDDKC